jgi:hypothetical protein
MNLRSQLDALITTAAAARDVARATPTPVTLQASIDASAAVSAFIVAHPALGPRVAPRRSAGQARGWNTIRSLAR